MASQSSEARVRAVSKALFGSGARLRAAAFIADHKEVYARQVAGEIHVAENEAGRELKHFSDAGLLNPPVGLPGGRRRQVYRREDSSFWALAKKLLREVEKPAE
jgi:hypothetical protein